MQHNFGIGGRGKDRAFALKVFSFFARERQIAVVTNRDLAVLAGNQKRLAFAQRDFTRGGIAHVADRAGPRHPSSVFD